MTTEERKEIEADLKARKILLKKFESVLKDLEKKSLSHKEKRKEKLLSLREYKTYEEAHEAYGWGYITEEEFRDIVAFIEKGDSEIENDLSPHEIAANIVRGYIKILRSDIFSLSFDLLPEKEKERERELAYQKAMEREKRKEEKEMNKDEIRTEIPEEYMVKGSFETGGIRKISPEGRYLEKKEIEEIECPCCGEKSLRIKNYGCDSFFPEYLVGCDNCDWDSPTGTISDYGEAPCEFKAWLEAFLLLGKPEKRVNEDLTLLFYPDGEWREKKREERKKEEER